MKIFIRNIKRIIKWIPVLWKDRDWDHNYLWEIINFKLQMMKDFFNSDKAMTSDAKITAAQIEGLMWKIYRIIDDDYGKDTMTKYYQKYGETGHYTEDVENEHWIRAKSIKLPTDDGAMNDEEERESFLNAVKEGEKLKAEDVRQVALYIEKYGKDWGKTSKREMAEDIGNYMRKYVTGWWD